MARALIVDDNLMVRTLLGKMLTDGGHEVVGEADDGLTAPVALRDSRAGLVFLDLVMPGRGGLDTLPHLLMVDPSVAIVVCSASLSEGRIIQVLRLGARAVLSKPFNRAGVLDAAHTAMAAAHGRGTRLLTPATPRPVGSGGEDRREYARLERRLPLTLQAGDGPRLYTVTADISVGGLLTGAPHPELEGETLRFRIHLDDRHPPVDGDGRAVRVDGEGRVGVQFEQMDVADYEALAAYIAELTRAAEPTQGP